MSMFNLGALASVLDSIDSAAKESLEDHKVSATTIRARRKGDQPSAENLVGQELPAKEAEEFAVSIDEHSNHSGRTQESYVVPSAPHSESNSVNESEDAVAGVTPVTTSQSSKVPKDVEELRKSLKNKGLAIEKLNREVLELEEHCNSLKDEVQEAWNQYKQAQEKAAFREAELLDEVKQIQKSKALDKQQSIAHMSKLSDDVAAMTKQMQAYHVEKAELLKQIESFDSVHAQWVDKVAALEADLVEARAHTIQGSQSLREEIKAVQATADQMRVDYALLTRQNQVRASELEADNAALTKAVADCEREIQRWRFAAEGGGAAGRGQDVSSVEHLQLQKELMQTVVDLEKEVEKSADYEVRMRQLEKEARGLQILYDEEKKRNNESCAKLLAKVQELEKSQAIARLPEATSVDARPDPPGKEDKEYTDLKAQVQHLSQLLLKRQASVLELQAERSALKARVSELEARCKQVEQNLSYIRDQDDDGEGDYYAVAAEEGQASSYRSGAAAGAGLSNRKGGAAAGRGRSGDGASQAQLISDLEMIGVKPNAGVSKAVTMIDTYALITGRFLRSYPLVRLGFVFYLVVLHLWVLFILVLHTHSLDLVDSPQDHISNY